jgi:hypothetical protein
MCKTPRAEVFHPTFDCQRTNYSFLGLIVLVEYHPNGKSTTPRQCLQNIVVCEKVAFRLLFPGIGYASDLLIVLRVASGCWRRTVIPLGSCVPGPQYRKRDLDCATDTPQTPQTYEERGSWLNLAFANGNLISSIRPRPGQDPTRDQK